MRVESNIKGLAPSEIDASKSEDMAATIRAVWAAFSVLGWNIIKQAIDIIENKRVAPAGTCLACFIQPNQLINYGVCITSGTLTWKLDIGNYCHIRPGFFRFMTEDGEGFIAWNQANGLWAVNSATPLESDPWSDNDLLDGTESSDEIKSMRTLRLDAALKKEQES